MKKIVLMLFLIIGALTNAQNKNINIDKDFIDYNEFILNKDFEKAVEYVPQDFFKLIPKDQMIIFMGQALNNPDLEIIADAPQDIKYGEVVLMQDKYYSIITYFYNLKMKFNDLELTGNQEEDEQSISLTKIALEQSFGEGNVIFNSETNFFEIHAIKKAVGISDDGNLDWKFLVIEQNQKPFLDKIFSPEVVNMLYKK